MLIMGPFSNGSRELMDKTEMSQVVILLDALDEADPPDELLQQPQAASSSEGGSSSGKQTCPVACGNSILLLITAHLKNLPSHVRFIFTTRPDAAAGQVMPCLERAFLCSVVRMSPAEYTPWPAVAWQQLLSAA